MCCFLWVTACAALKETRSDKGSAGVPVMEARRGEEGQSFVSARVTSNPRRSKSFPLKTFFFPAIASDQDIVLPRQEGAQRRSNCPIHLEFSNTLHGF